MAQSKKKLSPVVLAAIGIVAVAVLVICGGICTGMFVASNEAERCQKQGGFYKTDGGCDLPYPNGR
jgi:hypothetical protein